MSVVDWVVIVLLAIYALAGWRQGFIAGAFSFAGFLGGGIAAALLLPDLLERWVDTGPLLVLAVVASVLIAATVGQALAGIVGRRLRAVVAWGPIRLVDDTLGVALNVVAFAVVAWILVTAVAVLPVSPVTEAIRGSRVLVGLDSIVPDQARNAFTGLRDLAGTTALPRVFAGLGEITGPDVDPPDERATASPGVVESQDAVFRITAQADACSAAYSGSGYVFAPGRMLTNAHVVAGVNAVHVDDGNSLHAQDADVVYFDPRKDIAVLRVRGLDAEPLVVSPSAPRSGDDAVVAGYPGGGAFRLDAARVRTVVDARGESITGEAGVEREVIAFRGHVEPGNSGGPLLDARGAVLGMVFGSGVTDDSTGYAMTVADLESAMRDGATATKPVDTGACIARP